MSAFNEKSIRTWIDSINSVTEGLLQSFYQKYPEFDLMEIMKFLDSYHKFASPRIEYVKKAQKVLRSHGWNVKFNSTTLLLSLPDNMPRLPDCDLIYVDSDSLKEDK